MIKALLFAALAATTDAHKGGKKGGNVVPEPVAPTCNKTCLSIDVKDFYGDGWDSVKFHAEEEGGVSYELFPSCMSNEESLSLCPDSDTTFYLTAAHANGSYIPENYWEIFWTAKSHCDEEVVNTFTGGFNTSMIIDYVNNEWIVQYWENLWDNEKQCDACGDAQQCKPKKPKGHGGKGKGHGGKGKGKGPGGKGGGKGGNKPGDGSGKPLAGNHTYYNATGTGGNSTKTPKAKPRYGPPAVNLRVTMFDEYGDGWWKNDYSGESWFLADDRREKLFNTGTLCDGSVGSCNLCLGDGSYTMRFTGDASNFTAWDFCGVTGQRATELTFHVKKGQCYADSIVSLHTECTGTVESDVTLTGVVAISGFPDEVVAEGSYAVLAKSLASMVHGWSADNIRITGTTLDSRSASRRLSDFTQDFTFEVDFIAEEAFGVDGRSYSNVEALASSLYTTLSNKMASGQFETSLQLELALNNVVALSPSSTAELVSLEVGSVVFEGSDKMVVSSLPPADFNDYDETITVRKYNVEALAVFFGVAVAGLAAFVGIMRVNAASQVSYETLAEDSEQARDVRESEMETSTSPMMNAFNVDASPTTSLKL